ncbi:DUF3558 family protein [Actinoplanes auranticolor]|uniref:DUF3558 domain-containing protein n=1 Tax=Actinoplanes auranticolor TaxID=47988 RepID=A0A919SFL4_9ACTN|nr:DUF3558 family protein [Actinoplanes auranticolor]GIM70769.1 hypothetical protein Aau02nite_42600 [Actinoplanes auranticolor]
MDYRRPFAALVTCLALTGCGAGEQASTASPPAAASAAPSPTAASGLGDSVKDAGDIPDPCTLLSKEQVTELTGRKITRIDEDGLPRGDTNRYCQWQQSGGQLAVFLNRTTEPDFTVTIAGATPVNDVGERAFQLAGHLYVLYGTVAIDVYSRGDSDDENLAEAAAVAQVLIPKI